MSLKMSIYGFLVNRKPGINFRYHKFHDGKAGAEKIHSWLYLLWLNFAYYILFCRFLGKLPEAEIFEQKRVPFKTSESKKNLEDNPGLTVSHYVDAADDYDIVSFDIFDTLIFRPLCEPADLFYFVGEELKVMDFKRTRIWAEGDARFKNYLKKKHYEIGLSEIWEDLSEESGLDAKKGMDIEIETEKRLCYANPFMLEVWNELKKKGKKIIVVSDMYLPGKTLEEILEKNGFKGAERLYVSNEYGKNKYEGKLFEQVKNDYPGAKILHIGDNPKSDVVSAKKALFGVCQYPNTNRKMLEYRPYDMSYLVGSAYRGIVSNNLYNGLADFSMEYEYGYLYGGLFVLGYCSYIHEYCKTHNIDKILFLSRDGDILNKAYSFLYPGENTEYVYWSRKAALKLTAPYDKHDYFRRFLYHKVNQKIKIKKILEAMELGFLADELGDWKQINDDWNHKTYLEEDWEKCDRKFIDLKAEYELTDKNAYLLRRFIEAKWDKVIDTYSSQSEAAREYWSEVLKDSSKALAVDIGWAGSGAIALSHLVENVWEMPCEIIGMIAGSNTVHNAEPDASETFLQSGKMVSYMYSHAHNRDLLKKHNPGRDYNVFWELLLSSPQPRFEGFYPDGLHFGKKDYNPEGIAEIQNGIMDFVQTYKVRFKDYPYMFNISGRDAYAPMIAASGNHEKYFKEIEKKFELNINVE